MMRCPWALLMLAGASLDHVGATRGECPWATSVLLGHPWAMLVTLGYPQATLAGHLRAIGPPGPPKAMDWVIAVTTGPSAASWRRAACCHSNQEHPRGLSAGFSWGKAWFCMLLGGNPSFPALLQKLWAAPGAQQQPRGARWRLTWAYARFKPAFCFPQEQRSFLLYYMHCVQTHPPCT